MVVNVWGFRFRRVAKRNGGGFYDEAMKDDETMKKDEVTALAVAYL